MKYAQKSAVFIPKGLGRSRRVRTVTAHLDRSKGQLCHTQRGLALPSPPAARYTSVEGQDGCYPQKMRGTAISQPSIFYKPRISCNVTVMNYYSLLLS